MREGDLVRMTVAIVIALAVWGVLVLPALRVRGQAAGSGRILFAHRRPSKLGISRSLIWV